MMVRAARVGLAVGGVAAGAWADAPRYSVTEVGPRPLVNWSAYDLGPQGQVVGRAWDFNSAPQRSKGFVWQAGVMTLLDGPGGEPFTEARCIDDRGVVYGGFADRRFDLRLAKVNPVRWVNWAPVAYPGSEQINSTTIFAAAPTSGVAVGWAKPFTPGAPGWQGEYGYTGELAFGSADPVRAFRWTDAGGAVLERGLYVFDDRVSGINDSGQAAVVLGSYELGGAARYDPRFGLVRLPNLGQAGNGTFAFAINQSGQIVGYAQASGGVEHPVRWDGAAITDLGLLPGFVEGQALDINDAGVVVGGLSTQNFPFGLRDTAGFVFIDGAMHDLNQLIPTGGDFVVQEALAINNAGQILVSMNGVPPGPTSRFAVLTPVR